MYEGLPGFNPATGDPAALLDSLRGMAEGTIVEHVSVYGAGCGSEERRGRMRAALRTVWPDASLEVESDLLGTARGLFGTSPGTVLILGTGMNAAWYDGRALHTPMPSLGYILGDEGSGADIGKAALIAALQGEIPEATLQRIFPGGITMDTVARDLYRGSAPQAWLASFARPLLEAQDQHFATALITERFDRLAALLDRYFEGARRSDVRGSGSIAFFAKDLLQQALRRRGFTLTAVERSPLPGLVRYHQGPGR